MKQSYLKRRTPLKRGKPLRRVSKKRQDDNVLYKIAIQEWSEERIRIDGQKQCQFKGKPYAKDGCFGITHDDNGRCIMLAMHPPHHRKGRFGPLLYNKIWFQALCAEHHLWVESNKKEARKRGYILYK